jgi:aminoglycoside phosphotransferase (APT) family kinase protein
VSKKVSLGQAAAFLDARYAGRCRDVSELGGGDWSRAYSFCLDDRIRHVLHVDLLNRNVLVSEDGSRLEAVFDWGCSAYGDFLYDVAWITFWAPWFAALDLIGFREVIVRHYGSIGLDVRQFDERLTCYEIHIGLTRLAYCTFAGRDDERRAVARRLAIVLDTAGS